MCISERNVQTLAWSIFAEGFRGDKTPLVESKSIPCHSICKHFTEEESSSVLLLAAFTQGLAWGPSTLRTHTSLNVNENKTIS